MAGEGLSVQPVSAFFNSDGLKLHYLRWGPEGAQPIILLHGLRAYAQTWQSLADSLGDNYCLYALDQRGRGLSDWGAAQDYRTDVYVDDLKNMVDHLGLERFILIGHSLGGANGLEFNRQYPGYLQALIVEDIGPGSSIQGAGAERIRREMKQTPMHFPDWQAAKDFWRKGRPNLGDEAIASRAEFSMVEKTDGTVTWRHDQSGIAQARLTIPPTDLWPSVKSLDCKCLFIRGGDSDFLPVETIAKIKESKPHIESIEIANASHYVHDDQAVLFNQSVSEFLEKSLPAK